MSHHDKYKVGDIIPEGESGSWKVERFTVTAEQAQFEALRAMISSNRGRGVPEGTYTSLTRNGRVIMSDTPAEIRDHYEAIRRARGRVLIAGLGIAMVTRAILEKPEVDHVTVIDLSPDVIALVAPSIQARYGNRVEIVCADIMTWKPPKGARWDVAWYDIWDNIVSDNLTEMTALHRKFGTKVGWQGSWAKEECLYHKQRWEKEKARMGMFRP